MLKSRRGFHGALFLLPVYKAGWYPFAVALLVFFQPVRSSSETVLEYRINEELPAGGFVGDVARDFGFDQELPVSILSTLRFSFLTLPTSGDRMYFSIDERTGVIRTLAVINREEVCPDRTSGSQEDGGEEQCTIKFDAAVRPIEHFRIIKVRVEIVDINDNAPIFSPDSLAIDVSEAAELGTSFALPEAHDADSSSFGISHYELVPISGPFELIVRGRADGSFKLRLILRATLDRETTESYQMTLLAVDGGEPSYTGVLAISVTVRDTNDNSPVFAGNGSYSVFIDEDVPTGSVITRVTATDADLGENAQIRFDLAVETKREFGDMFGIETDTGELYTRAPLDFEGRPEYALYITATDSVGYDVMNAGAVVKTGESLTSQALVVVRLIDVNDNPPRIRVHALAASSQFTTSGSGSASANSSVAGGSWQLAVPETVPIGTFVTHVTVDDSDSGENSRFHCSVVDSPSFALRPLPPHLTEFKLVTIAPLDRELRSRHRFAIACRDNGRNSLTSTVPVEINVNDANDHSPEFAHTSYYATVAENIHVGASVIRVAASDRDSGSNGEVRYRLDSSKPEIARMVSVDAITGVISTAVSFDRETTPAIDFGVVAIDSGSPPQTARTHVYLTISDVDDELPVFLLSVYTFYITENQPAGSEVGFVSAIDRDMEPFDKFVYSSLQYRNSTSRIAPPFAIDAVTGRIKTLEPLDRELVASYELSAIATSKSLGGQRRHSNEISPVVSASACDVTVRVIDENDNRPYFRFPTSDNDRVIVPIGQVQRGRVVTQVLAADDDVGLNAQIEYRILYGDSADSRRGIFSIDRRTGDIRIETDEKPVEDEHLLTIVATDSGSPTLTERALLHVVFVSGSGDSRKSAWPRSAIDNDELGGSEVIGSILASGDLAVVLAVALGAVLVAIAIIIALACLATIRRSRRFLHDVSPPKHTNSQSFPMKSEIVNDVNLVDEKMLKCAIPLAEVASSDLVMATVNSKRSTSYPMTSLECGDKLEMVTTSAPMNELELSVTPVKGGTRPVVAFIKGLINETNNCSPSTSCDSNSDSGRGPSSEDGEVRRQHQYHQRQQPQPAMSLSHQTVIGSTTVSTARRVVLSTALSSNRDRTTADVGCTYNHTPRTDVTSLTADNSLSGSETSCTMRRISNKSDAPITRRSTKIDLTPDVISWYSAPVGGPIMHVRCDTSNINLDESSAHCWSNSCHLAQHHNGTSATLDRHQPHTSTTTRMKTLPSNRRGSAAAGQHVTWYNSATVDRCRSSTAEDVIERCRRPEVVNNKRKLGGTSCSAVNLVGLGSRDLGNRNSSNV